jgi:photosystem II stability/assembly factor-like uncharacterized protein
MNKKTCGFLLAALALLAVRPLAAAGWRPLPIWGGDVRALAIDPRDPDVVLAGTSGGQVYLSRDGGRGWGDAGAPLPFPGWVVSSLQFDPNRPARLWAALRGVWGGGHVASSDDLGRTWSTRGQGLGDEPVYSLALVPGKEGRLYAGTLSGVWGSEDGGASWRPLTTDLAEIQKVTSLVVDPGQTDTVIAGTWRRAYRSDDGGRTWAGVFEGMVLDTEVFSLTPIPGHPGEIWASTCGWVYQTRDRGARWERFKEGLEERRTPSFLPLPDGRMLAGTVAGIYLSADGGHTWKLASDPALSVTAFAYDPARPRRVILGTEGSGVWVSNDDVASFHPASDGMANTRVSALALAGDDLLVGVSHAGPVSGVHVSHDRGASFRTDFSPLPPVLDFAVVGKRIYAATERGLYQRLGADWHRVPELGDGRVEQLVAGGGQLVARTPAALFELRDGRFVPRAFKHGAPRSAALYGDALWVSDDKGLYRLTRDANHTIPAPFAGGRLQPLADRLFLWGPGGAFARTAEEEGWIELTQDPSRLLPTGDPRYSALLVTGSTVRLFDAEAHKFKVLDVPVPARDISAALVVDGKLLLGTSGYGVLVREVE